MEPHHFDYVAERLLTRLLTALDEIDDVEAELSQGVLTIQFDRGVPYVINSHRNAGQIWVAAERTAWHFSPTDDQASQWRSDKPPHEELYAVLQQLLSQKLGRNVQVSSA